MRGKMFQVQRKTGRDKSSIGEYSIRQNSFSLTGASEAVEYLTFPSLEETGVVKHLFSTRLGGVSDGDFATMNFSISMGDSRERVLANFGRIAQVLRCSVEDMVSSHQTHTTNIRRVTAADRGKGILYPGDYENVDGLITDEPGIVLTTYYADCVPLFFVDPVRRAIGLAHSGWRGTAAGMGSRMVEAMKNAFGSRPEDLYTAVGPSICADCYEVGGAVAEQFMRFPGVVRPGAKEGKYQLDLWLANRLILQNAGVAADRIAVTDICTCCNSAYLFSHRATGGKRGSLGAFLMLTDV